MKVIRTIVAASLMTIGGACPASAGAADQASERPSLIPTDLTRAPFTFDAAPAVATGLVGDGGAIVSGRLRYAYTARLTAPFAVTNKFGRFGFRGDETFYGVPFRQLGGIVFCSPFDVRGKSWAGCLLLFRKRPVTAISTDYNPYLVTGVTALFDATGDTPLALTVGDVDGIEPPEVRTRVTRWNARKVELVTEVLKNAAIVSAIKTSVGVKDGAGIVTIGDGIVRLLPAPGGGTVSVVVPPRAGGDVLPQRVGR